MNFLHPAFLFGLFAISIPIIVHLFNFRKAKRVYFSNTRFIQEVKKSTSSKRKLKHLLILLSRILFIIFLVLAFAQPYIPSKSGDVSSENVYLYIDNSLSMTNSTVQGMTGLDVALATAEKLTNIYPVNTNYKILTNDFAPFSNTLKNKDEVKELMTEIRRSSVSRTLEEIYERLNSDILSRESGKKEVYMISDFQKLTSGEITSIDFDSTQQIYLVPVEFPAYGNVFVDTAYLENPFLFEAVTNKLIVVLRNSSNDKKEDMIVKLFVNGVQSASSSLSIDPNATVTTFFDLSMPMQEVNKVMVSFEEFPVTFDNEFHLVLNKSDKINILEITGLAATSPVEKVFGNAELFNFQTRNVSNIDYSLINQADLLVINEISSLENTLVDVIRGFQNSGGYVLIVPGNNSDVATFQEIAGTSLKKLNAENAIQLSPPDMRNPFFDNIFDSQDDLIQMPSVEPTVQWASSRQDLLKFRNDQKYLSRTGENTFMFAAPFNDDSGNMHRHALFVPVMYKIAAMSKDARSSLYFSISQNSFSVELDSANNKNIYKLRSATNEYIPGQRIVGNKLNMEIPKYTFSAGFYDLYDEDRYLNSIALNLDKTESLLEVYTMEELEENFANHKNISVFNTISSDEVEEQIKELKFGVPLWKYALIISLLFLLAEILLIRFFK